nr:PhzF family phenazine biosynthesis protein [Xanthomonas sp. LMG 8992]
MGDPDAARNSGRTARTGGCWNWPKSARYARSRRSCLQSLPCFALCRQTGRIAFSDAAEHQLVVRAFAPGICVAEDPVTSSANALIAAMLAAQDRWPGHHGRYVDSQGRELGRDGRVARLVDGEAVWIGGLVRAVIAGKIAW